MYVKSPINILKKNGSAKNQSLSSIFESIQTQLIALTILGFLPRLILSFGSTAIPWPDSRAYLESAKDIATNLNFQSHEIYRTPGYPSFMALFIWIFGNTPVAGTFIILAQRLLGIATGLLLFLSYRSVVPSLIAFLAAALFLVSPLMLFYESSLLTESLFSFILALVIFQFFKLFEKSPTNPVSMKILIPLLCSCAALVLTRPIGLIIPFIAAFVGLLHFGLSKKTIASVFFCLLAFMLLLFPWMEVNQKSYGFFGLSKETGLNLFHKVLDVNQTVPPESSADQELRQLYLEFAQQPGVTYFKVFDSLEKLMHSRSAVDARMENFALEVAAAHPLETFEKTLETAYEFLANPRKSIYFCDGPNFKYLCSATKSRSLSIAPYNPHFLSKFYADLIKKMFRVLEFPYIIIFIFLLLGLVHWGIKERNNKQLFLLLSIMFYFGMATAVFNRAEDRFRVPVEGIILLFAVYGAACFFKMLRFVQIKK